MTQTNENPDARHASDQELERARKRDRVRELGLDPYGERTDDLRSLADAAARFDQHADQAFKQRGKEEGFEDQRPVVRVAGRVVLQRDNGKLIWLNLRDGTADLQIAISKRDCDERGFELAKLTDLGDLVVAEGPLAKTRTGEVTVWASSLRPAAKAMIPPPEKHAGLKDVEARYRRRYVDLWSNPEAMATMRLRSRLISRIRRFLDERGFLEVETPILQTLAGGAAARPFVTHMNALDIDLFMRVAPELFLKRLLVAGFSRVYEIARNFRNEGIDRSHNPEFTMLELYQAFADYRVMMELTESLTRELATLVVVSRCDCDAQADEDELPASLQIAFGDITVDYARPFEVVTYESLFERTHGFSMRDESAVGNAANKLSLDPKLDHWLIVGKLFDQAEEAIDPTRPTFVIDYPAPLCPLTRHKNADPTLAERFELHIAGMELANAYTELNNPDVQRQRFEAQLAGIDPEEQTFRTLDEDFLEALRVGMPPAGGLGIGIDRLVMAITGNNSIRDVLLFPLMRPLQETHPSTS